MNPKEIMGIFVPTQRLKKGACLSSAHHVRARAQRWRTFSHSEGDEASLVKKLFFIELPKKVAVNSYIKIATGIMYF